MSSHHTEVLNLLSALIPRVAKSTAVLNGQEMSNALYGLVKHMWFDFLLSALRLVSPFNVIYDDNIIFCAWLGCEIWIARMPLCVKFSLYSLTK
jgi:hypothetical protein